jgi:hypothetical protein
MFFWGGNKIQQELRALNLEEMKNKCCRHSWSCGATHLTTSSSRLQIVCKTLNVTRVWKSLAKTTTLNVCSICKSLAKKIHHKFVLNYMQISYKNYNNLLDMQISCKNHTTPCSHF